MFSYGTYEVNAERDLGKTNRPFDKPPGWPRAFIFFESWQGAIGSQWSSKDIRSESKENIVVTLSEDTDD